MTYLLQLRDEDVGAIFCVVGRARGDYRLDRSVETELDHLYAITESDWNRFNVGAISWDLKCK